MPKPFNILLTFAGVFAVSSVYSLPEGTTPVSGGGSFSVTENEMTINAPNNSIFEHQSFNVTSSEVVRFVQPDANARVLNRILSNTPSLVNGSIIANGKVFFASPGGLIFGEGSAVDVGLLHVIGGNISDENFLNSYYSYEQLTGTIENHGLINAREVILAGNKVINAGRINAHFGDVALAAGEGAIIQSIDGTLGVEVSQGNEIEDVVASDFAGQAVLQSGIIESARSRISADAIEQSGSIISEKITYSDFSYLNGSNGGHSANQIDVEPRTIESGVHADLSGPSNFVGVLNNTGRFDHLLFHAVGSTSIEGIAGSPTEGSTIYTQNSDFRANGGSLFINTSFAPIFTSLTSTFLAAADGELVFKNTEDPLAYDRAVIFGINVDTKILSSQETIFENWHALESTYLTAGDLEVGLTPSTILLLAQENLSFTGFSNGMPGVVAIGGVSETSDTTVPSTPDESGVSQPQVSVPSNTGGTISYDKPEFENLFPETSIGGGLSYEQLKTAMEYGLFSGYSYLIKLKPPEIYIEKPKILEEQIAELGGSAALFGGSYDVVESDESTVATSRDADEGESEEEDDSESSVTVMSDSADTKTIGSALSTPAFGVAPFSPISRPVYSAEAAGVLDAALGPQIFENLQQYTNR